MEVWGLLIAIIQGGDDNVSDQKQRMCRKCLDSGYILKTQTKYIQNVGCKRKRTVKDDSMIQ